MYELKTLQMINKKFVRKQNDGLMKVCNKKYKICHKVLPKSSSSQTNVNDDYEHI